MNTKWKPHAHVLTNRLKATQDNTVQSLEAHNDTDSKHSTACWREFKIDITVEYPQEAGVGGDVATNTRAATECEFRRQPQKLLQRKHCLPEKALELHRSALKDLLKTQAE